MKKLNDALAGLAALRSGASFPFEAGNDRLVDLDDFGSNPGNLRARIHVPEGIADHPALVVVLHGCTQTAAGYDAGSGWSQLADRHGFMLLYPEQKRENNPNLCFDWFLPDDARRDKGEALSIRQMIGHLVATRGVDADRVFITGLSAGGAMTSVMLASYPELFAGGAIIAGLPYGCASGVPQALARMRGEGLPTAAELDALLRRAAGHDGRWPTISVWHGSSDPTVNPVNAEAIVAQWRSVHGVTEAPDVRQTVDGYPRRAWRDATGREVIEEFSITGMGHGTPLDTRGEDPFGAAGPHMLEASISSTRHIAAFWGLTDAAGASHHETPASPPEQAPTATATVPALRTIRLTPEPQPTAPQKPSAIAKTIEDALRAAGLMR